MDLGLKGKRAIITGGSRGIGRAIAETLVDEGVDVAICARDAEGVKQAVESMQGRGVTVIGADVNVAKGEALQDWVRASIDELGGLDIYVHNASAGPLPGEKGWTKGLEVDLLSLDRVLEVALAPLGADGAGAVVAIGSTSAVEEFSPEPQPHFSLKAALVHRCGLLARSLARQGIRVNVVSPGPIFVEGGSWDQLKQHMPEFYEQTLADIPAGRFGMADDVARCVAFLASPAAGFVTGTNLIVDGGFTRRIDL